VRLAEGSAELIARALYTALAPYAGADLHGVSSLAAGADQLFAIAVLAYGGSLEVILPARDYQRDQIEAANRQLFDDLLSRAASVRVLDRKRSGPHAYQAAGEELLRRCDLLFAVWDEADGRSSCTSHVVAAARRIGMPVTVIWPKGARRR